MNQKTAFDTLGRALMRFWRLDGDKCVKKKAVAAEAPKPSSNVHAFIHITALPSKFPPLLLGSQSGKSLVPGSRKINFGSHSDAVLSWENIEVVLGKTACVNGAEA